MSDFISERGRALILAAAVLDRPNADPDDDLAVLARQLSRCAHENDQLRRPKAWLIEWPATIDQPVRWWHPERGWTIDASRAIRFTREEDAAAYIKHCGPAGLPMKFAIATEHLWS